MKKLFYPSSFWLFVLFFIVCSGTSKGIEISGFQAPSSASGPQQSAVKKTPANSSAQQKKKVSGKKKAKTGKEIIHNNENQKQTDSIKAAQNKLKGIK